MDNNQWEKVLKEEEKIRQWEKVLKEKGVNCFVCQKIITTAAYKKHNYWLRKEGIYHHKCRKWTSFNKILELDKEKKWTTWEELIKKYPCWDCDYNFTDKEIKKRNWQVEYSETNGLPEIYRISHIYCLNCLCSKCRECHGNVHGGCMDCAVPLGNLVITDYDTSYHPECLQKKEKYYSFHTHPQIKKIKIEKNKITAILEEGRENSIYFSWLIKNLRWPKDIKAEQLKKSKIINEEGFRVCFENKERDFDLDLTVFIFTEGKCGCCSPTNF